MEPCCFSPYFDAHKLELEYVPTKAAKAGKPFTAPVFLYLTAVKDLIQEAEWAHFVMLFVQALPALWHAD